MSSPAIALVRLAVAAMVVLAVALGFSLSTTDKQSSKGVPSKNNSDIEVCLTPSCVEAAAFILQNIDPSIDPCTDFYNFISVWKMGHEKHRSCRYTKLKPHYSSCIDNLLCKEQIIDYAR